MEALPTLTALDVFLRKHRPTQLNLWGSATFQLAFPRFAPPIWTDEEKERARATNPKLAALLFQPAQLRRFGGYDLGRGAYSSLAADESGFDWGTLCAELNAYRDRNDIDLYVEAADGWQFEAGYFGSALPENIAKLLPACFVVRLFPASRLLPLVEGRVSEMSQPHAPDNLRDDTIVYVIFKPEVTLSRIERIVDLRLPETRASFFEVFRTGIAASKLPEAVGKPLYCRPMGENISAFYQMLPELLNLEIGGGGGGGGGLTQAIGDYLRARGVSGLVYPSARADWFAEFLDGNLTRFGGWNFVDFRNSPPPEFRHFLIAGPWDLRIPDGVSINAPRSGPYMGSIQAKGLAEVSRSSYEKSRTARLMARLNSCQRALVFWGSTTLDEVATRDSGPELYDKFGAFLNAVCAFVVLNHGIEADKVKNSMEWLLDRGHFAEYSSKCVAGTGCTTADVEKAALLLKGFLSST